MRHDVRHALRSLLRQPGFAATAVLALALGLGAATAVFSVLDGVVLNPVPYPEPERLVSVLAARPERGPGTSAMTPADFLALRERSRSFGQLGAYVPFGTVDLTGEGEPVRLQRHLVSQGLLEALGVRAVAGRLFHAEEYEPGRRVALLSHRLWKERLGGGPIESGLRLDGERYEVAGVLPADFRLPGGDPDLLLPLAFAPGAAADRESAYLGGIGRLRPGVPLERARAEAAGLASGLARQFPETNRGLELRLAPLPESFALQARTALWVIFGAVGFVLLITCANVASLQLVRAVARERETSIRLALGATPARIARQALAESLILAGAGAALGLALAGLALRLPLDPRGIYLPASLGVGIGARAVGFSVLLALATAGLSGLLPALRTARGARLPGLRSGTGTGGPRHERLQGGLVVTEVALAFILLAGAGLLIRSFLSLLDEDLGFRPDRVLTLDLALPASRYAEPQQVAAFYRELAGRIGALPGVVAAGGAKEIPPAEPWAYTPSIEGEPEDEELSAGWHLVTPGYLEAMRTPVLAGRTIRDEDRAGGRRVALLNASAARALLPGRDPLGRRVPFNGDAYDVVGVIADQRSPGRGPEPAVYLAHAQSTVPVEMTRSLSLAIRAEGDPLALVAPVRSMVRALDRDLPVSRLETLEQRLAAAGPLSRSRFNARLLGAFSGLALLLAAVGIYGVLSYAVGRRTRELGVRMALGARRGDLLRRVLRRGLALALAGTALGLLGALALTRLLASLLVGVGRADPGTLAATAALLLAVATLACYLPARRASRLEPLAALHQE